MKIAPEPEARPKPDGDLRNKLRAVRNRLGLTQSDLANAAGVARQTIGGIEAALYAPSAVVALRLARALGCRVEDLFWLEAEVGQVLEAKRAKLGDSNDSNAENGRVVVGRVGAQWIAHSLDGEAAFRSEMVPADGIAAASQGQKISVRLLDSLEALERTVLIAGCSPALSLWTRSAQRWHPGLRAAWMEANSSDALAALMRGEVHLAGLHVYDAETGEDNTPLVRRQFQNEAVCLLNFGVWDEGLMVARGNPAQIRGVADLMNPRVRLINREAGAGSRVLLDTLLARENLPATTIAGYDDTVSGHRAVARAICAGRAGAGMGTAAMAAVFGLDFVPLQSVRFDFAVRAADLKHEPVAQLFETLSHPSVRLQLQKLGGYDTARTGDIVARVE